MRPKPRTRSIAATGVPNSAPATAAAASWAGSAGIAEHGGGDLPPIGAEDIAARCAGFRQQDAPDPGGEVRIGENLLEIVDEMGAFERGDAGELVRPIVLEKT